MVSAIGREAMMVCCALRTTGAANESRWCGQCTMRTSLSTLHSSPPLPHALNRAQDCLSGGRSVGQLQCHDR